MARIVSILNFKGGVGKSTTTVNVAKALHMEGHRVLVIDADPQGNASRMMGMKLTEENHETLYEAMLQGIDIRECICMDQEKEDSFDYVPANYRLSNAEQELISRIGRETVLRKLLQPVESAYDYILIDCPPNDGLITQNAMSASQYILVPMNGEPFAIDGMGKIISRYNEIKSNINPDLQILGYVFTLIRKCRLHEQAKADMRSQHTRNNWPGVVFDTEIRQSVVLAESAAARTNIFDYSRYESGAFAYKRLTQEIVERINQIKN